MPSGAEARNLEGVVTVNKRPVEQAIAVPPEYWKVCGMVKQPGQFLVSESGGVANTVIWIEGDLSKAPPYHYQELTLKKYQMDQAQCDFTPHVLLAPAGIPVEIHTLDATVHGVMGFTPEGRNIFNLTFPQPGYSVRKIFSEGGPHGLRCAVHPWMNGVIFIQTHPYFTVTDTDGRFKIPKIPEGKFQVFAWHEQLGRVKKTLETTDSKVEFQFTAPG